MNPDVSREDAYRLGATMYKVLTDAASSGKGTYIIELVVVDENTVNIVASKKRGW